MGIAVFGMNKSKRPTDFISMPMGIDYVVIGLDMEVQPLVPYNVA